MNLKSEKKKSGQNIVFRLQKLNALGAFTAVEYQ